MASTLEYDVTERCEWCVFRVSNGCEGDEGNPCERHGSKHFAVRQRCKVVVEGLSFGGRAPSSHPMGAARCFKYHGRRLDGSPDGSARCLFLGCLMSSSDHWAFPVGSTFPLSSVCVPVMRCPWDAARLDEVDYWLPSPQWVEVMAAAEGVDPDWVDGHPLSRFKMSKAGHRPWVLGRVDGSEGVWAGIMHQLEAHMSACLWYPGWDDPSELALFQLRAPAVGDPAGWADAAGGGSLSITLVKLGRLRVKNMVTGSMVDTFLVAPVERLQLRLPRVLTETTLKARDSVAQDSAPLAYVLWDLVDPTLGVDGNTVVPAVVLGKLMQFLPGELEEAPVQAPLDMRDANNLRVGLLQAMFVDSARGAF